MREDNYPRPVSDPESEGLPGTADDDSTADDGMESGREADGPDPAPLPGDHPLAMDRFGVTAEDARVGESLDYKLAREDREPGPGRGDDADAIDDQTDRPAPDAGLDEAVAVAAPGEPYSVYDVDDQGLGPGRPVGRLVQPDEGAHSDDEPDAVAFDAGPAGGGASAEELAMHEVPEP